jgi:hypothetical protein
MTVTSSQRTTLLEKYRCINVEYGDWFGGVEGDFIEDMKAVGIDVDRIYFSGFWSQGDGACFVGAMGNTLTYLDHHHQGQYPMIRMLLQHGGEVYVECSHTGRYYHENSTSFWVDADRFVGIMNQPTEFHTELAHAWQTELEYELEDFEEDITEQWRTYMQQLYRKLEAEYEYRTSDEAVWDTIEANELIEDLEEEEV